MIRRCLMLILIPMLAGCSAIELRRQSVHATQNATANERSATPKPDASVQQLRAKMQALSRGATQAFETLTAIANSTATEPPSTATPPEFFADSAVTVVYGRVPVDSDRLNVVAALAFDSQGRLLVSTRAGDVYRLLDADDDGVAEETRLIFSDADDELGQVSGLVALGEVLMLLNDGQLSRLQDQDKDGAYDTVTHLSQEMPADRSPLQANNSIVRAPDGRYFSADVGTGEILQIVLRE